MSVTISCCFGRCSTDWPTSTPTGFNLAVVTFPQVDDDHTPGGRSPPSGPADAHADTQQHAASSSSGARQPVRRRLALPGLPPREYRTAAAALAAQHSQQSQPQVRAQAAASHAQATQPTPQAGASGMAKSLAPSTAAKAAPAASSRPTAAADPAAAQSAAKRDQAGTSAAAAEVATVQAAVAGSRDTGLWAELAAELQGSRILEPAAPPPGVKRPDLSWHHTPCCSHIHPKQHNHCASQCSSGNHCTAHRQTP